METAKPSTIAKRLTDASIETVEEFAKSVTESSIPFEVGMILAESAETRYDNYPLEALRIIDAEFRRRLNICMFLSPEKADNLQQWLDELDATIRTNIFHVGRETYERLIQNPNEKSEPGPQAVFQFRTRMRQKIEALLSSAA